MIDEFNPEPKPDPLWTEVQTKWANVPKEARETHLKQLLSTAPDDLTKKELVEVWYLSGHTQKDLEELGNSLQAFVAKLSGQIQ